MTGGNIPLWRRLPKRGFTNARFRKEYSVVNVGQLNRFEEGTVVTPRLLEEAGLVKQPASNGVKVLGEGQLTRPLTVRADAFSKSAAAKIEQAGGVANPAGAARGALHAAADATERSQRCESSEE